MLNDKTMLWQAQQINKALFVSGTKACSSNYTSKINTFCLRISNQILAMLLIKEGHVRFIHLVLLWWNICETA